MVAATWCSWSVPMYPIAACNRTGVVFEAHTFQFGLKLAGLADLLQVRPFAFDVSVPLIRPCRAEQDIGKAPLVSSASARKTSDPLHIATIHSPITISSSPADCCHEPVRGPPLLGLDKC